MFIGIPLECSFCYYPRGRDYLQQLFLGRNTFLIILNIVLNRFISKMEMAAKLRA